MDKYNLRTLKLTSCSLIEHNVISLSRMVKLKKNVPIVVICFEFTKL